MTSPHLRAAPVVLAAVAAWSLAAASPAQGNPTPAQGNAAAPAAAATGAAAPDVPREFREYLVRCGTLVLAPGAAISPGELLVSDGVVAHVGRDIPTDVRARARVLDFAGATVVPGFVLPHSTLEQERDLAERAVAWTPELRVVEAFDPFQDELAELPRLGVTSCALAPSSDNVAGGIATLVKPGREFGRVAAPDAYLKLSLTAAARDQQRPPTSLMGAVDLVRTAFETARAGVVGGPDLRPVREVLQGARRVCIHADSFAELSAVLELCREFELEPMILGARDAHECLDRIAASRARLALRPLRPELRARDLALPARLEQAGVPFCFLGRPAELRTAAALAVRHGVSRETALAAITLTPAELLGFDRVGALRRGRAADFAVFDGDPLDLSARLLATFVDGVLLSGATPAATRSNPGLAAAEENE